MELRVGCCAWKRGYPGKRSASCSTKRASEVSATAT